MTIILNEKQLKQKHPPDNFIIAVPLSHCFRPTMLSFHFECDDNDIGLERSRVLMTDFIVAICMY